MTTVPFDVARLVRFVTELHRSLLDYTGHNLKIEGKDAVFQLHSRDDGSLLVSFPLFYDPNNPQDTDLTELHGYASEKANRLSRAIAEFLSSQSRNESMRQYGGAFKGKHFIWSISGYDEEDDEALAAMSALICGDIEWEPLVAIFSQYTNKHFDPANDDELQVLLLEQVSGGIR